MDLGAMAMKGYTAFPKAPALREHHQVVSCHNLDTLEGSLTPLQRSSRCILQLLVNSIVDGKAGDLSRG